jgi:hypothetical protein
LQEVIDEKSQATLKLVSALMQMNGAPPTKDDVHEKYQKAKSEVCGRLLYIIGLLIPYKVISLRSQLNVVQSELEDVQTQRDVLHTDLVASNTRLDRLNSRTIQASLARKQPDVAEAHTRGANTDSEVEMKTEAPEPSSQAVSNRVGQCRQRVSDIISV